MHFKFYVISIFYFKVKLYDKVSLELKSNLRFYILIKILVSQGR